MSTVFLPTGLELNDILRGFVHDSNRQKSKDIPFRKEYAICQSFLKTLSPARGQSFFDHQYRMQLARTLNTGDVGAGAGIHPDGIAFIYKNWHIYLNAGLNRNSFGDSGCRVAFDGYRGARDK